ncbi:ABC transporter ATP-binding protein [Bacteroidota bacterium]
MSTATSYSISLEGVSLGYPGKKELLSDIHVAIGAGEMVALVGRNGSGKTTLLKAIARLHKEIGGAIHINGKPISSYSMSEYAAQVAYAGTMKSITENLTVFELVSTGRYPYTNWWGSLRSSDREKIIEAISFVGMESHIESRVERLSDGERQRVLIATALVQDAQIILLDEPTAFLDIPNRIGISDVLHKLAGEGRTIVFSTHDMESTFSYADRVWLIHDCSLIQGAPEDLGLQKEFENAFRNEDLVFDDSNLKFRKKTISRYSAKLQVADQREFDWTRRALERIAYTVLTSSDKAVPDVRISKKALSGDWIIEQKDTRHIVPSLYDMVKYLKKER